MFYASPINIYHEMTRNWRRMFVAFVVMDRHINHELPELRRSRRLRMHPWRGFAASQFFTHRHQFELYAGKVEIVIAILPKTARLVKRDPGKRGHQLERPKPVPPGFGFAAS